MTRHLLGRVGATALAVIAGLAFMSTIVKAETTLERVKREGVVRVGFANEPPFGFATPEGVLAGESPEIAKAILVKMGLDKVELEGVLTPFGSLIPGLLANRFDMIAAGMFVRPARCKQIAFSEPTAGIGEALLVAAHNPKNLHSFEDIAKSPDAKIAVISGGAERDYAKAVNIPDDRIAVFPDNPSGLAAVASGQADALALTSLVIQGLVDAAKNPAIERAAPFTDPVINGQSVRGYGAFGFRQEDADFVTAFNTALKGFIGTPEHAAIVSKYGFTAADLPGDVTTANLCKG